MLAVVVLNGITLMIDWYRDPSIIDYTDGNSITYLIRNLPFGLLVYLYD